MADNNITFYDSYRSELPEENLGANPSEQAELKDQSSKKEAQPTPRFQLPQSYIVSHYPPNQGQGDYRATLPSLVLSDSALPWIRSPLKKDASGQDTPHIKNSAWLYLLLIDESETALVTEHNGLALAELADLYASEANDNSPLSSEEIAQLPEKINHLNLDESLINLIPATLQSLQHLSYARIKNSNSHNPKDTIEKHAVIMGNRVPEPGSTSTVYLISIENNYIQNGSAIAYNGIRHTSNQLVFPYFYKWQFHTWKDQTYAITKAVTQKINQALTSQSRQVADLDFSTIYDHQYQNIKEFRQVLINPPFSIEPTDPRMKIIEPLAKSPGTTFHGLMSNISILGSLATDKAPDAIDVTKSQGLQFSNGEESVSQKTTNRYYGPLVTNMINHQALKPDWPILEDGAIPSSAQDLVLQDKNGKTDQGYALAFDLGRTLALNDVDFSWEFFQWKREMAMTLREKQLQQKSSYRNVLHLPISDSPKVIPLPDHVKTKFESWKQLEGIPYRYLVPGPDLLPDESLRFFQVNRYWINAFLTGAFSIGHTVAADLTSYLKDLFTQDMVTGFLLRSFAVCGWPDFMVDVHTAKGSKQVSLIRKDNIGDDIKLYLLSGKYDQLVFHLHPGKKHSGFLFEGGQFTKEEGTVRAKLSSLNVVDIDQLYKDLKCTSKTAFARKMMEGTPAVTFEIS